MRIIGYIDHPVLKITIFQMDNRVSVKFESSLYEQVYKFRDGEGIEGIEGMEAVEKLVDQAFIDAVLKEMEAMHGIKQRAMQKFSVDEEEDFEEII